MTTAFVPTPWTWPRRVWSLMTAAPEWELLTVAQGKLRAGLDWEDGDPRDELMTDFIKAARAQVEHDTGLALPQQTHRVTFAFGSCFNGYQPAIRIPTPPQTQPTQSITVVETGELLVAGWGIYTPGYHDAVPVTEGPLDIVSGWPTIEALKEEAPGLYHAVGLLTAHYATLGRDLATVGDLAYLTEARYMPMGYEAAIAPHRLLWVT